MTRNHLNLTVTDVPAARRFLETYLGLQGSRKPYTDEAIPDAGNSGLSVLFDDTRLVLTLMNGRDDLEYPATFHIGFMQEASRR